MPEPVSSSNCAFPSSWPGDNVIHDHRAGCGDRFLNGGAARFSDEQMILAKNLRQILAPADDLHVCRLHGGLDFLAKLLIAPDRDGQLNFQPAEQPGYFGRAAGARVDHIQNARAVDCRGGRAAWQIGKSRIHRKSQNLDFGFRNALAAQDSRALFVRQDEIIGLRTKPDGVDRDGIGHHRDAAGATAR